MLLLLITEGVRVARMGEGRGCLQDFGWEARSEETTDKT